MLGYRDPQKSFYEVQELPHKVPDERISFYGRMGSTIRKILSDDDFAKMYCIDGRPSIPPSSISCVVRLQFYDNASDHKAVVNMNFDIRWKVALDLSIDYEGFDPSSLLNFRKQLIEHGKPGGFLYG